jgi:hypothetical protein
MSAGPRCYLDHRVITPGQESAKRVEWWDTGDGTETIFSDALPEAPGLSQARGRLIKAAHSKCFFADRRRIERQGVAGLPDAPGQSPGEGMPDGRAGTGRRDSAGGD